MNIEVHTEPFPHLTLHNVHDECEIKHIMRELEFLTYTHKLSPNDESNVLVDPNVQKHRAGSCANKGPYQINLALVYANKIYSNILMIYEKFLSNEFKLQVANSHFYFGGYRHISIVGTVINYYENKDSYGAHSDKCVFTALTWFNKTPKQYEGGDLFFPKYNYTYKVEHGKTLIFPSWLHHEVLPISMPETECDDLGALSCNGRYNITLFMYI
jgi:hypothetical protein